MPIITENRTGLPHVWFEKAGVGGVRFDVLVVRATFDFSQYGERVSPSQDQTPIVWGDEFDGPVQDDPLRAVLKREGDLILYKPRADIQVTGYAQPEEGKAQQSWMAGIAVNEHKKLLRLHGPRRFESGLLGWRLTSSDSTASVALDYRNAFGGCFSVPADDGEEIVFAYKKDNPAGCGWLPSANAFKDLSRRERKRIEADIVKIKTMPAPQMEDPKRPLDHPHSDLPAESLSPMARWCEPRLRHAGTYDEVWLAKRYPQLPEDFDPAFYQSAHPDLILNSHLEGNEAIILNGLLPEGRRDMYLPGIRLLGAVTHASGGKAVRELKLDTARFELDTRQIVLLWRTALERKDPVRQATLVAVQTPEHIGK
jgi:hypothetical protein